MAEMAAMQEGVIDALHASDDAYVANRLDRCMRARKGRRSDDGRPWTCRSAGCQWCGRTLIRRWWVGIQRWMTRGPEPVSLAVLPLQHLPGELRAAIPHLRRACRDVRDRAARKHARWRGVALAGMAFGDGTALLLIRHSAVALAEVADVVVGRWPDAILREGTSASPCWSLAPEDAIGLARARRGVEPLRVVVLPQRVHQQHGSPPVTVEPMPMLF
jgi:hypothetical protein